MNADAYRVDSNVVYRSPIGIQVFSQFRGNKVTRNIVHEATTPFDFSSVAGTVTTEYGTDPAMQNTNR